jgi:hypothetical protein
LQNISGTLAATWWQKLAADFYSFEPIEGSTEKVNKMKLQRKKLKDTVMVSNLIYLKKLKAFSCWINITN